MNASDDNFRQPDVLTVDGSTQAPGDQLRLLSMNLLSTGADSHAWSNQEFAFFRNWGR
ncbi:MAG TPA: hypothetical protein VFQ44_04020 [Streptosporangiaceae bacterium]|nr:hypothetical protein [Streptosporangiaceae bacterium]